MTDVEIITAVVEYIATLLGERADEQPSVERNIVHAMVGMTLLSQACGDDPDSIRAFVDSILKQPSKSFRIDSV